MGDNVSVAPDPQLELAKIQQESIKELLRIVVSLHDRVKALETLVLEEVRPGSNSTS